MRICMICPNYPPQTHGASRYYYDVARKFSERGIYVEVITYTLGNKKEIEKDGRITIHRIPSMNWKDRTNFEEKTKRFYNYLKNLFKKKAFDLISSQHLYYWNLYNPGFSVATNLISLTYKVPNILTIHTDMASDPNDLDNIPVRFLFWDKIVCVSNNSSEKIHDLGLEVEKIATGYPGVDLEKFKPGLGRKWLRSRVNAKEKDKIFLFAGRLIEDKGLSTLLKSFSNLAQNKRDVKLVFAAARGSYTKEEFEDSVKKTLDKAKILGIENKVIIQPFQLDEMPLVYNGCDIFVLPSKAEGFGLSYAEAMACGIPVIGTSVGGVPEVISNGEDGFLIPPENPTELTKRMEFLLKNKRRRELMGEKGKQKVKQKFDLNKTTDKLVGIYKSVLEKNTKSKQPSNVLTNIMDQIIKE